MSTGLIIICCIVLIAIVVVQIGKVTELSAKIRGEEEVQYETNRRNGLLWLVFGFVFLVGCVWSAVYYVPWMLGYGPHEAASEHGGALDSLFDQTVWCTAPVFFITHIALFWFAYKYQGRKGSKASFISHDNKLEIIWTAIPAVVMCFLVIQGLVAWNEVMADIEPGEEHIEIEATGQQFLWHIRYPGPDGKLGGKHFRKIVPGQNPLGQDWMDDKNLDDIHATEIVLPVGKKVRVRINAMDVLHNFDLPHFRVKMDAVPGMPTYFVFTPKTTTDEYRQQLREYPEYQVPTDPADPNSEPLWKTFEYELACAELCGSGHFSMRRLVKIVSEDEYEDWLAQQQSFYFSNVRDKDYDPRKDELFLIEETLHKQELDLSVEKALASEIADEKIVRLDYITFESGSANLKPRSKAELKRVVAFVMNKYPNMTIEIAGHTDNTGKTDSNQALSQARAQTVYDFLSGQGIAADRMYPRGYGETIPIDTNDTAEGRQKNRRTEFQILTK